MNPHTENEILKLENAVAELDTSWLIQQRSFKVHKDGNGENSMPSIKEANIMIRTAIGGLILLYGFHFFSTGRTLIGLIGMTLLCFIILLAGFIMRSKAKHYIESKNSYLDKRANLILQIEKLKAQ